jgi:hypothetical protein
VLTTLRLSAPAFGDRLQARRLRPSGSPESEHRTRTPNDSVELLGASAERHLVARRLPRVTTLRALMERRDRRVSRSLLSSPGPPPPRVPLARARWATMCHGDDSTGERRRCDAIGEVNVRAWQSAYPGGDARQLLGQPASARTPHAVPEPSARAMVGRGTAGCRPPP